MASKRYHRFMATNLRLGPDAEEAVRREAERTGHSQQDVIREAINVHLGLSAGEDRNGELGALVATGAVRPPRASYRKVAKRLTLPPEVNTADLLDRDDRV